MSRLAFHRYGALVGTSLSWIGQVESWEAAEVAPAVSSFTLNMRGPDDGQAQGVRMRSFFCCRCTLTAVSLNSGASRSTMVSAPVGHSPRQAPRPSQNVSLTTSAFPPLSSMAPSAQAVTQLPQPLHNDRSILIILRLTIALLTHPFVFILSVVAQLPPEGLSRGV